MLNAAKITGGHIDNREGKVTWQNADSSGTAENSSITVSGGTLALWDSSHPITIPVILKGGVVKSEAGLGSAVNRLTSSLVITNPLPSSCIAGDKALNFEGPVRLEASGTVACWSSGTNAFSSSFSSRDAVKLAAGTYIFKDAVSVPRGKDFTCSGGDVFFGGDVARDSFGGLVVTSSGRMTLERGSLFPRMLRASNGGAVYGTFRNVAGTFADSPDDIAYIGESAGSLGVFVQERDAVTTFSNSFYVGYAVNSYGFALQRGGTFTHRRNGIVHLGFKGNGFLWVAGGTNDSHFADYNTQRLKMSEEDGKSTLVVRGKGSLLRTDSLFAGNATNPTTNTIAVTDGGILRAHRFYSVAGRAAGSFSCVQIDGGTLSPSYFSGWGDAGTSSATFRERSFDRVTVHSGGVTFDTTGCLNNNREETEFSFNVLNFERPGGRGVKSVALPTDAAFKALKYKSPVPIVFEGAGYGATAYADFDFATGRLTGVVVGSEGCDYDGTSRAYVLAPSGNPAKYACTIELTDDNRPSGTFTKRGAKVALSLYGTNDCSGVIVESGTLTAAGARALPENVPVTIMKGATLKPYEGSVYAVSALEGEGGVDGADVRLADGGTVYVTAGEIFAPGAQPLSFTRKLTLGKGVKVVVRDPENLDKYVNSAPATILTASTLECEGVPTFQIGLGANWQVYRSGNSIRTVYNRGTAVLLK